MIFSRLAYLPISLKKVILIDESLFKYESLLLRKNLSIYTPNTRLHLFQYLVLMAESFDYSLIEEGKLSFKDKSRVSINYKNKKFDEKLIDLLIVIVFNFIVISRVFLDITKILIIKKKFIIKYLKKYFNAPIFNLNHLELNNKKPLTINKISKNAFLNISIKNQYIYSKKSNIEISTLKNFNKKYKKEKNYLIYVLSGDSIPVLKKEFDYSILNKIDINKLLIRPHPALFGTNIKTIDKILSLNLSRR